MVSQSLETKLGCLGAKEGRVRKQVWLDGVGKGRLWGYLPSKGGWQSHASWGQGSAGPMILTEASLEQRFSGILGCGRCEVPPTKTGMRVACEAGSETVGSSLQ